jgi:4-hydroxy-2-oxovalerate/4-hydroxy-2-oxohexanoate aldolase
VFAAVCERMGIETGVDLFKLMDVAEDVIVPMMDHLVRVDRESLTLGFAGVYSTFLLHAKRARSASACRRGDPGRAGPQEDDRRAGGHDRGHGHDHGQGRGLLQDVARAA